MNNEINFVKIRQPDGSLSDPYYFKSDIFIIKVLFDESKNEYVFKDNISINDIQKAYKDNKILILLEYSQVPQPFERGNTYIYSLQNVWFDEMGTFPQFTFVRSNNLKQFEFWIYWDIFDEKDIIEYSEKDYKAQFSQNKVIVVNAEIDSNGQSINCDISASDANELLNQGNSLIIKVHQTGASAQYFSLYYPIDRQSNLTTFYKLNSIKSKPYITLQAATGSFSATWNYYSASGSGAIM